VVCLYMHAETLKRHLEDVEERVAQNVPLVIEQRTLVARLERIGRDKEAARARELLALLEESLRLHIADRDRLRELREYQIGSSTSQDAPPPPCGHCDHRRAVAEATSPADLSLIAAKQRAASAGAQL
jgi:hypothetical protein